MDTKYWITMRVSEAEKRLYKAVGDYQGLAWPYRKGRHTQGEFPVVVVQKHLMDLGYHVWVSGQSKIGIPVFNLFMFPGARKNRDESFLTMVNVFGEETIRDFILDVEQQKKAKGLRRNGGDPDLFVQNPQDPTEKFFVEVKAEESTSKRRYKDKLNRQQLLVFPLIVKHLMCEVRIARVQISSK